MQILACFSISQVFECLSNAIVVQRSDAHIQYWYDRVRDVAITKCEHASTLDFDEGRRLPDQCIFPLNFEFVFEFHVQQMSME